MMSSTFLKQTVFSVLSIQLLITCVVCDKFTLDLRVAYFSDVPLICDHPDLQIALQNDVRSTAWIFPDGTVHDSSRKPESKRFQLSGVSDRLAAYNLTVLDVSDDIFGYYWCIVVYDSQNKSLDVIRWGLNVDGADFSQLMQTYQDNAIIGGIAAAAMLVALGAVFLLWHFRYSNRHRVPQTDLEEKLNDGHVLELPASGLHNQSYLPDQEMATVTLEPEADGNIIRVKM